MKKGFTLIELLAVIVILAIIALIATPIVLNIINDSRESSTLRSADFYLDAIEYTIADAVLHKGGLENGDYPIDNNGNLCMVALTSGTCPNDKTLTVEVNGEKPSSGSIIITNGNIVGANIILNGKEIIKNSKGELIYQKTFFEVCKYLNNGVSEKTAGAKYECEVKPGTKYNFYVLTTPTSTDTTINLIMDRNINSDGTPVTKAISSSSPENGIYNLVEWVSKTDYNDDSSWFINSIDEGNSSKGPITAMNFLSEATKTWTNVNELLINTFIMYDGMEQPETKNMKAYNTYARLPYESELSNVSADTIWLIDYLDGEYDADSEIVGRNGISGINGYWTLTASMSGFSVWYVDAYVGTNVNSLYDNSIGVRPVITLGL